MFTEYPDEDNTIEMELERIKKSLGIINSNSTMTNEEIKVVVLKFAEREPDTEYDEIGKPVFGAKGVETLLTITLYYYPRYYVGLSQPQ